jgi:tRNA pseudouridine38-40 synthase
VQAAVESCLLTLGITAPLQVAARTDAGVNAIDQVVSFATRTDLEPDSLRRAVNESAPEGLLCLSAARIDPSFHARTSALGRRYVYLVGTPPPPGLEPYAWTLPDERAFPGIAEARLDVKAMREALAFAVGTHDFAGFARPGAQRTTVRTVTRAEVVAAEPFPLVALLFEGRGFLRAMVRHLVGTAVAAGLGVVQPEALKEQLLAKTRYRGVRAPGWGLTLAKVSYPAGTIPWK